MNRSLLAECNGEHWLLSVLPTEPLIVDVGFHRGDFSREALRLRPHARIVGFDPAASMLRAFATAFAGEPRVELLPFAVGSAQGEAEFHDSGDGSSSLVGEPSPGAVTYRVETITLDEFANKRGWSRIDLLKIDARGTICTSSKEPSGSWPVRSSTSSRSSTTRHGSRLADS
jgi:FkbM family methyltransferase